jgi:hypothetical protein
MIEAAVPTNFRKTLHVPQMGASAHCVYTDARYPKGIGDFVAFDGLKAVRSEGGDLTKGIYLITMIPFPPIA